MSHVFYPLTLLSIHRPTSALVTKIYHYTSTTTKPAVTWSMAWTHVANIGVTADTVTAPTVQQQFRRYYICQRGWVVVCGQGSDGKRQRVELRVMISVEKCVLSGANVVSMLLGCDDCWTQMGDGEDNMLQYYYQLILSALWQ